MSSELDEKQRKDQYRQTLHQAYINNQMELDKTIIALSTAAIGFVYSSFQNTNLCWLAPFFWGALLFFLTSIIGVLLVFYWNGRWTELESLIETGDSVDDLKRQERSKIECRCKHTDLIIRISFALGILFCVILFLFKGINMNDKKMEDQPIKSGVRQDSAISSSFRPPIQPANQANTESSFKPPVSQSNPTPNQTNNGSSKSN